MKLTPHFTLEELAGTTTQYQAQNLAAAQKILGRMYQLAGFAERVRGIIGQPVRISSGYRCAPLNRAVGGSATSQHVRAEALDIQVPGKTAHEVFQILAASNLQYGQLILETAANAQWVHVSMGSKKEKLKYEGGTYIRL